ncbi:hypothetical protein ACHAXT_012746 [Thalassiosira profunda]
MAAAAQFVWARDGVGSEEYPAHLLADENGDSDGSVVQIRWLVGGFPSGNVVHLPRENIRFDTGRRRRGRQAPAASNAPKSSVAKKREGGMATARRCTDARASSPQAKRARVKVKGEDPLPERVASTSTKHEYDVETPTKVNDTAMGLTTNGVVLEAVTSAITMEEECIPDAVPSAAVKTEEDDTDDEDVARHQMETENERLKSEIQQLKRENKALKRGADGATDKLVEENKQLRAEIGQLKAQLEKANDAVGEETNGEDGDDDDDDEVVFVGTNSSSDPPAGTTAREQRRSRRGAQNPDEPDQYYRNRVNDGSDLSITDAVQLTGTKWVKEGTVDAAVNFVEDDLHDIVEHMPIPTAEAGSSQDGFQGRLNQLALDDEVQRIVPDRICSVACHPSIHKLLVCAGDKQGHIGLWNADASAATEGKHIFKPHSAHVRSLDWVGNGTTLLSSSHDGTVRLFDVHKGVFEEIFATYDASKQHEAKPGYNTVHAESSYLHCLEVDQASNGKCFFLSTSEGTVMHVDTRTRATVTMDRKLSNEKINTVSLHPEGNVIATAGLSRVVELWDLRMVRDRNYLGPPPVPIACQNAGKSINSAFFSPSGRKLLTTTQANKLEILEDAHLASGDISVPSNRSIKHCNQTGKWLSTFVAKWHPSTSMGDIFVVGNIEKPRGIEVFDGEGKLLRELRGKPLHAVASRCCFHPNADKLVVVGGNSSGRVVVAR